MKCISNVLIISNFVRESNDFRSKSLFSFFSSVNIDFMSPDAFARFLAIEPPLDNDYNFALNNSEGLCNLFDFDSCM